MSRRDQTRRLALGAAISLASVLGAWSSAASADGAERDPDHPVEPERHGPPDTLPEPARPDAPPASNPSKDSKPAPPAEPTVAAAVAETPAARSAAVEFDGAVVAVGQPPVPPELEPDAAEPVVAVGQPPVPPDLAPVVVDHLDPQDLGRTLRRAADAAARVLSALRF